MSHPNRDLLILFNEDLRSKASIEMEVSWLHEMLYKAEALDSFCAAHELIDLNRYKVFNSPHKVKNVLLRRDFIPFEFVCNKN